ncbi:unnamed protein product [Larinioides sclopetarius]|uniref:Galectin n=1 Tax=Larinioides sclopetarius TaxID=280406 RepID=A0AAV2AX27_9ARAC
MSKILRPSMPFQTGVPGGIYNGKMIEIRGRIPYGAERIGINLIAGYESSSDRVLHLSIRFDQHCVVRNHRQYGEWGPEERQGPFPFSFGRDFTIVIAVERAKYRIAVNNQHCWDFRHRLPMERVKAFGMEGSVDVHEIEFIDGSNPYLPSYSTTSFVSPSSYVTPGYVTHVTPVRQSLAPVYNPVIPFAYPIYGGLKPGMTIYISGQPSYNPNKFTINLQKGAAQYPPPDVAFHFDPRFYNRSVVRNTQCNGVWAAEETYISHFPFHPGVSFDLVIRVHADRYSVSINGQHFTDFRHRLRPLEKFDTLYIENDVSISSIRFS